MSLLKGLIIYNADGRALVAKLDDLGVNENELSGLLTALNMFSNGLLNGTINSLTTTNGYKIITNSLGIRKYISRVIIESDSNINLAYKVKQLSNDDNNVITCEVSSDGELLTNLLSGWEERVIRVIDNEPLFYVHYKPVISYEAIKGNDIYYSIIYKDNNDEEIISNVLMELGYAIADNITSIYRFMETSNTQELEPLKERISIIINNYDSRKQENDLLSIKLRAVRNLDNSIKQLLNDLLKEIRK